MKKNKIENVSIGSDPELFLFSESENKHITAIGLVGGTKDSPTPITRDGHFIQEDGVAMEFNIPPCKSKEELVKHINFVKNYLLDTVAKPNNCVLSTKASATFSDEQLNHHQAQEIGCCPDINSWDMTINEPREYQSNLRACGKIGCHLN